MDSSSSVITGVQITGSEGQEGVASSAESGVEVQSNPNPNPQPIRPVAVVPILLFEEELQAQDVDVILNRLVIRNPREVLAELTDAEKDMMNDFLVVVTKDPLEDERDLHLILDNAGGHNLLTLGRRWGEIVTANGLQSGDKVQGWGHRVGDDNQFRFQIRVIKKIDPQ